jgi:hypothetical protein
MALSRKKRKLINRILLQMIFTEVNYSLLCFTSMKDQMATREGGE